MLFQYVVFDLDNTLYPRGSGVMEEIGRRIQIWLCRELDLTWEQATTLRRQYLQRHGTTMGGLKAEHAVDIRRYLDFVHDIPVEEYLEPNSALRDMLERIPLRKAVYTNATSAHGKRVLSALGIGKHIERVIGIEEVGLHNKFNREAYERMLTLLEATGLECVMVEDSPRNLPAAKAVGMTTVLVLDGRGTDVKDDVQDAVDFTVDGVLEVEQVVHRLLESPSSEIGRVASLHGESVARP